MRFEQESMGRGPRDIQTHLIGNLLVVRLASVGPQINSVRVGLPLRNRRCRPAPRPGPREAWPR